MLAELDILDRLAVEAAVEKRIYYGVAWSSYVWLLEELGDGTHLRVTFDCGVLEIMSPKSEHEEVARLIDLVLAHMALEQNRNVKNCGSMTMHTVAVERGGEPDSCYYVATEPQVRGVKKIDLQIHPPPDIVLEIDITSPSLSKFPLYTALRVPEVWRYDGARIQFLSLVKDEYQLATHSHSFPHLSSAMLERYLLIGCTQGSSAMLRAVKAEIAPGGPPR